jgi:hypothetical protein
MRPNATLSRKNLRSITIIGSFQVGNSSGDGGGRE